MVIKNFLQKLTGKANELDLSKFKQISKQCAKDPANSYSILTNQFGNEIRELAIKNSKEKYGEDWKQMSLDQKESEIDAEQKRLWEKIKSGGSSALALLFGFSIG